MRVKTLRVMGSASDVEESLVSTVICRAFARAGIRVAPFKSQNALNSAGGELILRKPAFVIGVRNRRAGCGVLTYQSRPGIPCRDE
jgi:hypothetical protein